MFFPRLHSKLDLLVDLVRQVIGMLRVVINQGVHIMAVEDDLKTIVTTIAADVTALVPDVAAVQTAVTAETTALTAALAAAGSGAIPPATLAAIQASITNLQALDQPLRDAGTALAAVATAATAAVPTPTPAP